MCEKEHMKFRYIKNCQKKPMNVLCTKNVCVMKVEEGRERRTNDNDDDAH
jgi:hypothetical protein